MQNGLGRQGVLHVRGSWNVLSRNKLEKKIERLGGRAWLSMGKGKNIFVKDNVTGNEYTSGG
jgi:hypothetical protein